MNNHPDQLFRFRSWPQEGRNYTRELLEESAFYCSGPREFDDPHDSHLGAHATGSHLDIDRWLLHDMAEIPALMRKYKLPSLTQLNEQTVTDPKDRKTLAAIARRKARRHTRVLCLSGEWANELMWAFYGDNHRGVCLCFNTEHEFFQNAKPVLYTKSPVDIEDVTDSQAETDHMVYCKSFAWQFQKEWRLVFPGDEPKKVQFPRETLTAVILGYRFPDPLFDGLKQVLINGGYRVQVFRAERTPQTYEFGLRNIGRIAPAESKNSAQPKKF
jgi:hypothetical protein